MAAEYHRPNLRAALIEEGRRLLLKDGYAQFSLRRLSASLDVSHNAPYRHFASREDLIKTIVAEDSSRFSAALAAGVEGVARPEERLYRLGEAYVLFFLDNPEVYLLFVTLPGQVALQGEAIIASLFAPPPCDDPDCGDLALLAETARPLMERFPGLSPREVILGYWAKVHGLAGLLVARPDSLPAGNLRERIRVLVRTPF